MSKVKVKCGAIEKEVSKGALRHYIAAGWKVLSEKNAKDNKNDKTDSKENASS